jgi:hypothetical protein
VTLVALAVGSAACGGSEAGRDSVAAGVGRDTAAPAGDSAVDSIPVDTNVVTVTGPTVLAAFPVTESEAGRSAALGEALENFQRHLDSAGDSLSAHGVEVHERYGATVHWRYGDTVITRQVPPDRPIYMFLSPTAGEQFVLGVQTDSALFAQAMRHFASRRPPGGS